MAFAYFLHHAPWLLLLILGFWIIAKLWKGWQQWRNDRKRKAWNDMNKTSSAKHHARRVPHKLGAHDWY